MEVAAAYHQILVRQHDGVVGSGIDLGLHHACNVADSVLCRTVYLRGATEAVRILYVLFVSLYQFTALGIFANGSGSLQLTFVRTHEMQAFIERFYTAIEGVKAQAQYHIGLTAQTLRLKQAPDSVAAHKLSAVEKGQTLFALQLDRLPAFGGIYLGCLAAAAFPVDLTHTKHRRQHQVGERTQVAAGAKAALLVYNRQYVIIEAVDKTLHGLKLGTAVTEAEVLHFQQKHQLHNFLRHLVTDAAGVAHHQIALQLAELLFADADVAKAAEASRYAVDGLFLGFHLAVQVVAAFLYSALSLVAQGNCHILVNDFTDHCYGQRLFRCDIMSHLECISVVGNQFF